MVDQPLPQLPLEVFPTVKQAQIITSELDVSNLPPCPVTRENVKEWTEAKCNKAEATKAQDLDELKLLVITISVNTMNL
jgi:hypothetical protein